MSQTSLLQFAHAGQHFELKRYPYSAVSQLRAWDAADLYLLDETCKRLSGLAPGQLAIVHDQFGALSLSLLELRPLVYGDSWLSFEAIRRNLAANSLPVANINTLDSLDQLGRAAPCALAIGRVPKNKAQLAALLSALRENMQDGAELLLAGMDKHLSKGQFDLLAQYFGPSEFLPGWKKARVWRARVDSSVTRVPVEPAPVALPEFALQLGAGPNVFSRERLDIGSRFLLANLDLIPKCERVADLACGNGVLGLAYMHRCEQARVYFCDESFQAVASTKSNLERHFPEREAEVEAVDGLNNVADGSLELIICNPPFHQQTTVSIDIARSLFRDAKRKLGPEGQLWIVANRHLGYHKLLRKLFGNCAVQASDHKFVLLQSIRMNCD